MDIFFHDPDDVPVPPDEVRIREFSANPYPDGRRVRIYLEVSPFQKRPSSEITITNHAGRIFATANIIESMTRKMELTLHLRGEVADGEYLVNADLFYQAAPAEQENGDNQPVDLPKRENVDHAQTYFTLPTADA